MRLGSICDGQAEREDVFPVALRSFVFSCPVLDHRCRLAVVTVAVVLCQRVGDPDQTLPQFPHQKKPMNPICKACENLSAPRSLRLMRHQKHKTRVTSCKNRCFAKRNLGKEKHEASSNMEKESRMNSVGECNTKTSWNVKSHTIWYTSSRSM